MNEISKLRQQIDKTDLQITKLIEKRFELSKKIGEIKIKNGLKIENNKRENEIIRNKEKQYLKNIFKCIIKESRKEQESLTS